MFKRRYVLELTGILLGMALFITVIITACAPHGSGAEQTTSGSQQTTASRPPETSASSESTSEQTQSSAQTSEQTTPPQETSASSDSVWTPVSTSSPATSGSGDVLSLSWGGICYNNAVMEIVSTGSKFEKYQSVLNTMKEKLPAVNVYAVYCPTAIEFKGPSKYYGKQLDAMNRAYAGLVGVKGADTWSYLDMYRDQPIYFKTDTHWSQLGAYCAYRGFADAAGFTAHELSDYQTGSYSGFKGYFYNMKANASILHLLEPDTLTYYLPVEPCNAYVYSSPAMSGGSKIAVVNTSFSESNSYKYYCFTGGDRPLIKIESQTVSNGRTLLMLKDSYGNALVPFLPDHFEKVFVVDPRSFNTSDTPSFDIVKFCTDNGVTDILVQTNAFNAQGGLITNISNMIK